MTPDPLSLSVLQPGDEVRWINTGRVAYTDHYTHLWPEGDPQPYLSRNFGREQVAADLKNPGYLHWLVLYKAIPAGICKLDMERHQPGFIPEKALFLEKLYLKKEFTGLGLGTRILERIMEYAGQLHKKAIWLEAMQQGPALRFYRKMGFRILGETAIPYPEALPETRAMWIMGREF